MRVKHRPASRKGSDVVGAVGGTANAAVAFESDKDDAKYVTIPIEDKFNVVSTYDVAVTKTARTPRWQRPRRLSGGTRGPSGSQKFNYMAPK
jgi:hypothetical protein